MDSTDIVLTYKDTTLFKEDVDLLNDGNWLNDKIISFYFEFVKINAYYNVSNLYV